MTALHRDRGSRAREEGNRSWPTFRNPPIPRNRLNNSPIHGLRRCTNSRHLHKAREAAGNASRTVRRPVGRIPTIGTDQVRPRYTFASKAAEDWSDNHRDQYKKPRNNCFQFGSIHFAYRRSGSPRCSQVSRRRSCPSRNRSDHKWSSFLAQKSLMLGSVSWFRLGDRATRSSQSSTSIPWGMKWEHIEFSCMSLSLDRVTVLPVHSRLRNHSRRGSTRRLRRRSSKMHPHHRRMRVHNKSPLPGQHPRR